MKKLLTGIAFSLVILSFGAAISEAQLSSGHLSSTATAVRDLWEKLGNAIFPANLNWNVGIGTQQPQAKLDVNGSATVSGNVGIGTSSPGEVLDVATDDSSISHIRLSAYGDPIYPTVHTRRARGTQAGPLAVASGDSLGGFGSWGYDGSAFQWGGRVTFNVDGAPGTGSMPTRLIISTTPAGSGSPVERMRIDSSGNVGIGTTGPGVKLDVAGDVRWSGTLQGGVVPWANILGFPGDITPDTIADDGIITDSEASDALAINNGLLFAPVSGNVGIGTTGPGEKLTVAGMIQSTSGGFKFPDGTVQATAATSGSGGVTSLNGLTGPVSIAGGGSASVSVSGSTITISTPTCTPATVPIQCNSPYGGCSASCPSGYVIISWVCSSGLPTISGNTGTCTLQGWSVSGWGTCQIVC